MKTKITAIMIVLGMLLLASNALAQQTLREMGEYDTIDKLEPTSLGLKVWMKTFKDMDNTCDGSRFFLDSTEDGYKTKATVLIASFYLNKPIMINYDFDAQTCYFPIVNLVVQ